MTDLETQVKRFLDAASEEGNCYAFVTTEPAFVKALCESWLKMNNCRFNQGLIEYHLKDSIEIDTLRAQVEKMRAAMGNVQPLLARLVDLLLNGYDAREAALTYEAIQEALREISSLEDQRDESIDEAGK